MSPYLLSFGFFVALATLPLSSASAQERKNWQREWGNTLEAARREGQVNIYASPVPSPAVEFFQKAYPEIRVNRVIGRGSSNLQRIVAERRAKQYIADVFTAGITETFPLYSTKMFDPIKPALILPEVLDTSKWWEKRHRYGDPEGQFIFIYLGVPQGGSIYYNIAMVDPRQLRSLWDLLQPGWKGKMVARDPRIPGPGGGSMRFFYHHPKLGPEFIRRLFSETEIDLVRDFRQGTDWLARGKFAICFFCGDVAKAKAQGLPVDRLGVMQEGAGLVAQGGTLALINQAPHPNAAKVFINWLLSGEGQIAVQKGNAMQGTGVPESLRIDIPKDEIPPDERRIAGFEYLDLDTPDRFDMKPIFKVLEAALAEAQKKR